MNRNFYGILHSAKSL